MFSEFLKPFHDYCRNEEAAKITLRRLALEVEMQEGTVSNKLTRKVTHIVAYTPSASPVAFQTILKRYTRRFLEFDCLNSRLD